LEAIDAAIRDINRMVAGSLRAVQETRQLMAWIDTIFGESASSRG